MVRGVQQGEVPDPALEMMNKERDWIMSHLESDSMDYLKNLPTELKMKFEGIKIHAFHATPTSLFEVVLPDEKDETLVEKMMGVDADIYVYAHIHKPYIRYMGGKCIINIGSVGLPFDGLNKASYMILDVNENSFQTTIVRVGYNVEQVINQFRESDYPNREILMNILCEAKV